MRTARGLPSAFAWLALAAFGAAAAETEPTERETPWHPLHPARVALLREEPPTSMDAATYAELTRIHEQFGEGDLDDAEAGLARLEKRSLNDYERAQVLQTYGFIHSQQGREDEAFAAFEQCVALDALPTFAQQGIVYSVASYYSTEERFEDSNAMLMRWFRFEEKPTADAYMLAGVNHVQSEELLAGLPYVRLANALAPKPRENWQQVELAILVEAKRHDEAIDLLHRMVALWPDRMTYYESLSGLFMETGQERRALAALAVAWLRGLLSAERHFVTLAQLSMFLDKPERGARILADAIDAGQVSPTEEHLELLLHAWTAARETSRAAQAIDRLAEVAESGEYHLRKALLLNETGDWGGAAEAAQRALEKGGLAQPGEAWILRGVALAELQRYDEALDAFASAEQDGERNVRRNAASWIAYVRDRAGGSKSAMTDQPSD